MVMNGWVRRISSAHLIKYTQIDMIIGRIESNVEWSLNFVACYSNIHSAAELLKSNGI